MSASVSLSLFFLSNVFVLSLMREIKIDGVFGGWSEGILNFPPTYKYEINSDKYHGEDPGVEKHTPSGVRWACDDANIIVMYEFPGAELSPVDKMQLMMNFLIDSVIILGAITSIDVESEQLQVLLLIL
ncbi:hypothetical protein RIF29_18267 [Crotalaria pallida]|uniref:Uncharacterized protein n=1 Tax=Crotalaria pallida TaxID=3830 RepID=A0AAN9IFB4_CROPI